MSKPTMEDILRGLSAVDSDFIFFNVMDKEVAALFHTMKWDGLITFQTDEKGIIWGTVNVSPLGLARIGCIDESMRLCDAGLTRDEFLAIV